MVYAIPEDITRWPPSQPDHPRQTGKKRPKQSKEQNLLDRLEGYEDCILAFLWNWQLPFTNNEAERAFRMMKVRSKDLRLFSHIGRRPPSRSHPQLYLQRLRKHGLPVLEYLRHALDGHPFLPVGSQST